MLDLLIVQATKSDEVNEVFYIMLLHMVNGSFGAICGLGGNMAAGLADLPRIVHMPNNADHAAIFMSLLCRRIYGSPWSCSSMPHEVHRREKLAVGLLDNIACQDLPRQPPNFIIRIQLTKQ